MPMKKGMDMARSRVNAHGMKGLDRAAAAHSKAGVPKGKGKGLANRGKRVV